MSTGTRGALISRNLSGSKWRQPFPGEHMPDYVAEYPDGTRRHYSGHSRCFVHGLQNGSVCLQQRLIDSPYCYYHTKVYDGRIVPGEWWLDGLQNPQPEELYPVWPLPKNGYFLTTEDREDIAA